MHRHSFPLARACRYLTRSQTSCLHRPQRHRCLATPSIGPRSHYSTFDAAVAEATAIVEEEAPLITDPLSLVRDEMLGLTANIHSLLGSADLDLDKIAKYYIRDDGAKRLRPLLVLLVAKAIPRSSRPDHLHGHEDVPISPREVLNDANPSARPAEPHASASSSSLTSADGMSAISPSQCRLAEITEMIHAASLLHDDVIDNSDTRRGAPSAHVAFSSPKMAILCGDFMLGRASVALARLRHPEVTELLATVIANLVEGEFMQLKNEISKGFDHTLEYYLQKTYLKTASLVAKSCRASALLGGASQADADAAYLFGKNLGLGFQVVDDMLDYTSSANSLGKPAGADLKLGLATAPVLYAWQEHPELGDLIARKFNHDGDVDRAKRLSIESNGLERTRQLAQAYTDEAVHQVRKLPPSPARDALESIALRILTRTK